jgi:hypothetical protein
MATHEYYRRRPTTDDVRATGRGVSTSDDGDSRPRAAMEVVAPELGW